MLDNIITRLNRLPKELHKDIFKAIHQKDFLGYIKNYSLMMEWKTNDYQLGVSYNDYLELLKYERELKLKRIVNAKNN